MNAIKTGATIAPKATTETPTNGKVINQTPVVSLKKEEPTAATPPPPPPVPIEKIELAPIEDRILKVQMLSDLTAKREKLVDSLAKISRYKFATECRRDKLTIEDEDGNEFLTTNTEVLNEVIATIKATIIRKISEVDAQIIF